MKTLTQEAKIMSTIEGTIFDDNLAGTATDNFIFGNAGNDTLSGLGGDDLIDGWTGNDQLFGDSGNDILLGYTGNDSLLGDVGTDLLVGEAGDDLLQGYGQTEFEYDILSGGVGADTFVLGDASGVFYKESGFATISDFEWTEGDKIQVFGSISDYSLSEFDGGMDIFYHNDLIGYVENNTDVLLESDFIFL